MPVCITPLCLASVCVLFSVQWEFTSLGRSGQLYLFVFLGNIHQPTAILCATWQEIMTFDGEEVRKVGRKDISKSSVWLTRCLCLLVQFHLPPLPFLSHVTHRAEAATLSAFISPWPVVPAPPLSVVSSQHSSHSKKLWKLPFNPFNKI